MNLEDQAEFLRRREAFYGSPLARAEAHIESGLGIKLDPLPAGKMRPFGEFPGSRLAKLVRASIAVGDIEEVMGVVKAITSPHR